MEKVGFDELMQDFDIDKEKVKKMASFTGAPGGKLDLKELKPGDSVTITIVGEPYKVKHEKIEAATGKPYAYYVRVNKDGIEYDMVLSKTITMGLLAEMEKHGFRDLKGRTFKILATKWEDAPEKYKADKGEVKTYKVIYVGAGASSSTKEVTELEL